MSPALGRFPGRRRSSGRCTTCWGPSTTASPAGPSRRYSRATRSSWGARPPRPSHAPAAGRPINLPLSLQPAAWLMRSPLGPRRRELMLEAQREFDARAGPLCPEQLAAPVLHKVLSHPAVQVGWAALRQLQLPRPQPRRLVQIAARPSPSSDAPPCALRGGCRSTSGAARASARRATARRSSCAAARRRSRRCAASWEGSWACCACRSPSRRRPASRRPRWVRCAAPPSWLHGPAAAPALALRWRQAWRGGPAGLSH
jgi:hypothetical protein